jgi:hypothetical protein
VQSLPDIAFHALSADDRLLDRIVDGHELGIIVRGVVPPDVVAAFRERLLHDALAPVRVPSAHFDGFMLGRVLVVAEPPLDAYFEDAARHHAFLARLAPEGLDVAATLRALLATMAGGARVEVPRGATGRAHAPATGRVLTPGGRIHVHCENETLGFPAMRALAAQLSPESQASFYLPLALPEGGGALHVHRVRHGEASGEPVQRLARSGAEVRDYLAKHEGFVANPGIGDVLVFDAGRHHHHVTAVEGTRARITYGGFVARAKRRDHWLAWG